MKKRSMALIALLVMCAMLMSGFAVTAAVDPTAQYSFTESFDVAKAPAVTTAGVAEDYSQFVSIKVHDEDATLTNLSVADGQINTAAAMTYSVSSGKAVPVVAETSLTGSAAYVVDFDIKRTGASGMKAAYLGFRVPAAHATQDEMFYKTNTQHGIWLGMGTNFAVAPVGAGVDPSVSNVNNQIGDGARWTSLKKDGNATKMTNHTTFRAYDDLAENKVTICMVEEDDSETFYASITVGAYDSANDTTALTYQIMDKEATVLNVPGTIAGAGECYPQIVSFNIKPEIYSFGITGCAVENAGLSSLKFNGEDCDLAQYEYTGIDPLAGGVVTVEAEAGWGAHYAIYVFDTEADDWELLDAKTGLNTVDVSSASKVKVSVTNHEATTDYIFELSDNIPGAVTAAPEAGHFESAQEITLTGRTDRDDNNIYYTLDGSDPSDEENSGRILYTAPFTVPANAETTVKAVEEINGIYGSVAEFVYDIFVDVEEPTFSLAEGDYSTARTVELSTEETTTIYYTLDESDPSDEENASRIEYTEAFELALVEDVKTTYVVKAVAYRDDTYSEVVSKTYGIGVQKEIYKIDPVKIINATDPNFGSHNSEADGQVRFQTGSEEGWVMVEKGTDNTYQWEMATLKTQITSEKQGYSIDFDVKNMDKRDAGHQGISIMLRKKTSGFEAGDMLTYNEAPVLMFYKNEIGVRNGNWGNNCATRIAVPGMNLGSETHVTVTDDFVTDVSVIYFDGEPVAYGKLNGTTYTLTVIETGETASATFVAAPSESCYVGMSVSHTAAEFKDFTVTVARPAALNILTVSKTGGEYENNVSVEITKYNEELTLYYTIDGSDPADASNENRIVYTGAINLTETKTLKAVATDGTESTEMFEAVYTIIPYQPEDVTFSLLSGEYSSAQTLTLEGSGKPGSVIYYTTDGSDPSVSSNANRVVYIDGTDVAIPNNAETTVKAVEVIGTLAGQVISHTYYTGTVKSPGIRYAANMQKLVIGEEPTWVSVDSRTTPTSFCLVDGSNDTAVLSKGADGTRQHTTMRFFRSLSSADRAYKLEVFVAEAADSADTYRALVISPRSGTTESITDKHTPRILFQKSQIGIRTGNWGKTDAGTMLSIPGMDLATGAKVEFVDDMEKNVITIYVGGKLVVIGKINGSNLVLTAVETGETINWNGTINAAGYPRISSAHNPSTIKDIAITYPYSYDLPIIPSHTARSYVGAQSITLKNYFDTPVYYTLDGSDPKDALNANRTLYEGAITLGVGETTLKAAHYDADTDTYGGEIEKSYKIYADKASVAAELEALITEENTLADQKLMISAVFDVAEFTIENDSCYTALSNKDKWVEAYVEVLKEAREAKGSELDFTDAKECAYKAAVVAYFMDNIAAGDVSEVVTKANDNKQQYKMNIPLTELGFNNMPASVQTWILNKIKSNPVPDTEKLYEYMYAAVALSAVSAECRVSGYTQTEKSTALSVVMNKTDLITSDDTFKGWGLGSQKQTKAVNKILEKAKTTTITTVEQLKTVADEAVTAAGASGEGGGKDGPTVEKGTGGNSSFGAVAGSIVVPQVIVRFPDAKTDAPWAYDAILALNNLEVISGYPDGSFCANNNVTREEFVKMLVVALNLYDESASCDLTDAAQGNWYDAYIASAVNHGIVQGVSETEFGVGVNISRQDMAVIVFRAVQSLGKQLPDVQETAEFTDETAIAEYAGEAVDELQSANIINGMGDGTFAPGANATRAQAAYIINSILAVVNEA